MPPAARITDTHTCPMVTGVVPHVGGPVIKGDATILIGFMPAARLGDQCVCTGPPDVIVKGSATVLFGNMMAARQGDSTAHGGVIAMGCPTVLIGDSGGGGGGGGAPGSGQSGGDPGVEATITAARELGGSEGGTTEAISIATLPVTCECANGHCAEAFEEAAQDGTPLVDRDTYGCGGPPRQVVDTGRHYLEIILVGEDGYGIPRERYRVEMPDGKSREGHLGDNGQVMLEGIEEPGMCTITFPNLDAEAWEEA